MNLGQYGGEVPQKIFPDYEKKRDVDLVKDTVAFLLEKTRLELEKNDSILMRNQLQKLTEWTRVLSNDLGDKKQNSTIHVGRDYWMGYEFLLFATHENLNVSRPFVYFERNDEFSGFDLVEHPFDKNAPLHEIPYGGISCQGLKLFLSQTTPVALFRDGHFFLAETKGRYIFVIFQL